MLRRLALTAFALTGVPLVAAWLISQRVLHPKAKVEDHTLGDFDLPAEEITFLSRDGTRLAGWYMPPPNAAVPRPGIVLSHGHGRSRAELLPHADMFHSAGYAVLAFDYRHRGESDGAAVTMGLDERGDLQGALDALMARPEVDASRIGVFGMSMGGVVAMLVAADDERIRAIVAEAPYATREAVMTNALRHFYHLPSFPLAPLAKWVAERRLGEAMDVPDAIDVVRALAPRPLFFIADERDAVLGPEEARRLFDAAVEPKRFWLVPGADHARGWQAAADEYESRVVGFFREALGSPAPDSCRGALGTERSALTAATDSDVVLRTVGLAKRFGRLQAVQDMSLEVHRGRVYGFLGPNGAGKTTTIGIVLGLLAPGGGHVEMFGLDTRTDHPAALRRTGAILEGQAYYPLLSARDNLRVWAALVDGITEQRIDEVLELVGLASRAKDKARTYSQGMKQRLGLAGALLHDPDLLVLDEPTNGLDPAGIREFRDLIRELASAGKTVFVSSHLLGEVQQMCDDVGIVKGGRLITEGEVTSLLRRGEALELRVTDAERALGVLEALDWVRSVSREGDALVVEAALERATDVSRALAEQQIYLSELRPREGSLEDFFLEVTGEPAA